MYQKENPKTIEILPTPDQWIKVGEFGNGEIFACGDLRKLVYPNDFPDIEYRFSEYPVTNK